MYHVLIADDDFGMRLLLKKAIEKNDAFVVEAEAENGQQALELLAEKAVDLVFLDVEMPILNGIETARKISDIAPDMPLVFVTAHEAYRPQAFEVYAMDYLVKPFSVARLDETLSRIEKWLGAKKSAQSLPAPPVTRKLSRIMIKGRDEAVLLAFDDIVMVKREDRQSIICTRDGSEIATRDSLSELEARLPDDTFFRSHKSYIINLDYISHIYPYGRWTYITRLRGTKFDALITREKYEELEGMIH